MKRIVLVAFLLLAAAGSRGQAGGANAGSGWSQQEAEENYKMLKGQVADLIEARADQDKRLDVLARQIAELRDQVTTLSSTLSTLSANKYASQEDVIHLREAIQEIDRKRQADRELILGEFAKLEKIVEAAAAAAAAVPAPPPPIVHETIKPVIRPKPQPDPPESNITEAGYYYVIKHNDSLGLIAKYYRDQGVKVSVKQIEKANPDMDPDKLQVGQKIFIPSPKADASKPVTNPN